MTWFSSTDPRDDLWKKGLEDNVVFAADKTDFVFVVLLGSEHLAEMHGGIHTAEAAPEDEDAFFGLGHELRALGFAAGVPL